MACNEDDGTSRMAMETGNKKIVIAIKVSSSLNFEFQMTNFLFNQ